MRRYKLNAIAGKSIALPINGDFFRVIAGDSEFSVKPDTHQKLAGLQSGMAWEANKPFKQLIFESDTNQNIEIMAGEGRIEDNRSNVSGVVDTAGRGMTIQSSKVNVTVAPAMLIASNSDRRSITIENTSGTDAIYVGASGVTTANGFIVGPGTLMTIDNAAGAEIHAVSTATCEVRMFEELT